MSEEQSLIVKEFGYSQTQVDIIKSSIAKDATNEELAYFLSVAKRTKLDPFSKQLYLIKRKQKQSDGSYKSAATIQTGIDGYRAIAAATGELAGIDDAIYIGEEQAQPKKASVTVYRFVNGQRVAFTSSARWDEYVQKDAKGKPKGLWGKMPFLMLAKCAEALALRKAFPNDLSGLYTNEEMSQADSEVQEVRPVAPKKPEKSAMDFLPEYMKAIEAATSIEQLVEIKTKFKKDLKQIRRDDQERIMEAMQRKHEHLIDLENAHVEEQPKEATPVEQAIDVLGGKVIESNPKENGQS